VPVEKVNDNLREGGPGDAIIDCQRARNPLKKRGVEERGRYESKRSSINRDTGEESP